MSATLFYACFEKESKLRWGQVGEQLSVMYQGSHRKLKSFFKDFSRTKIIFQGPFMECHVTRLAK